MVDSAGEVCGSARGGGRWNEKLIRRGVRRESEVFLVASEIRKGLRKGCAKVS